MSSLKSVPSLGHGNRIKTRRVLLGLTQTAVAKAVGVTPPTIGQWEREETAPKGQNAVRLAKVLEVSPDWIITGRQSRGGKYPTPPNDSFSYIPLFPLDTLKKTFKVSIGQINPDELIAISRHLSDKAFAVRAEGDAMVNPYGGPSMPNGTLLVVDPQNKAINGSFVIAVTGKAGPLFRQYIVDGPHRWLKALNPDYSRLSVTKSDVILGTVVKLETELVNVR